MSVAEESNPKRKRRASNIEPSPSGSITPKDDTRKLAQASRTLKACELCRKQKTRCFRSPENPNSCLRCRFLSKTCSFEKEDNPDNIGGVLPFNLSSQETTKKIDSIHDGITEILGFLKNGSRNQDAKLSLDASVSMRDRSNSVILDSDSNIPSFDSFGTLASASPFSIMSNLFGNQSNHSPLHSNIPVSENIISLGILSESEVIELIANFRRNYGRWVSFPSSLSTETLVNQMQVKSSLLLTSCCIVAFRYQEYEIPENKAIKYYMLVQQLMKDLNNSFVKHTSIGSTTGQVEFLQAIAILSIYSPSISKLDEAVNLDPWLLSNIGLSTFLTKTAFGDFKEVDDETLEIHGDRYTKVMILRIYNHLCLAHIVNSLFSGRMCIIDATRVKKCATTLSLLNATNFDGRMVSEIGLLFITYNYLQAASEVDGYQHLDEIFDRVVQDIKAWFVQWEYLFNQPALHFLEFNYNFCSMLVYYIYCFQKLKLLGEVASNGLMNQDILNDVFKKIDNEELLITMFDYCSQVLAHINNIDNDSYFAYLSDQIHFSFYFCGVFSIKLTKVMNAREILPTNHKNKHLKNVKQLVKKFERKNV
ncbi:Zinc-finger transcription factor, putative [Candida maltosa Xu316]|uniref:Zinc-finger transcription factor, putative n=1 Tax=Candida maltosa (strain Xu316) TaxID=1245528 RepID=M3J9M0_CANMX|nr:Zinc-finger transcription factor, putative [Candida maltosa Xu316]